MTARSSMAGFSLTELLVSLSLLSVISVALGGFLVENSRINRSQQMATEVQANARNTLSIIVQKLRTAGWDPAPAGIPSVALDPDTSDSIDQLEVFADFDGDGLTDKDGEQVLIRHVGDRVEWRMLAAGSFTPLAVNISNDADGDGTVELMFEPLPNPDPTRIRVQITARSPAVDPISKEFLRYTVSSDVVLRREVDR